MKLHDQFPVPTSSRAVPKKCHRPVPASPSLRGERERVGVTLK